MKCLEDKNYIMKRKIHLPILIEQDEDKMFIVSCPTYRGCHADGETIEEAMKNISEVIEMYMEEEKSENINEFIGFRELEFSVA
jgi:predicted RNase H-like HicB family nuclease